MMTHDDIRLRAHEIAVGLAPNERAAVAVLLVETIRQTADFTAVNQAARFIGEHGSSLCKANLDGLSYLPVPDHPTEATTHTSKESREATRPRKSRTRASGEWRYWLEDAIGALALFVLLFVGLFWGGLQ